VSGSKEFLLVFLLVRRGPSGDSRTGRDERSAMRMISEAEREEIEKLLFLDVDELYSLIAPFDPQYSRTWFSPEARGMRGKNCLKKCGMH
jgi:hypothetical protein